ncbi:MAG: hypothetical protein V1774_07645 [Candidatus Eisenbacteria bacterium]
MKRFRFRMEGLEKIREAAVDRARLRLAGSERVRRTEEERLMQIDAALAREVGSVPRTGMLDTHALLEEERRVLSLRDERQAAIVRLDEWIQTVETDRERLLGARQEARALARLRERRYLEFVREVLHDEKEQIDESAGVRHLLRRRQAA